MTRLCQGQNGCAKELRGCPILRFYGMDYISAFDAMDYISAMVSSTPLDALPDRPKIRADLQDVTDQVHHEFADRLDHREIDDCLERVAAKFDSAKVRAFVPLLVQRYVRDELLSRLERTQPA